MWVVVITFMFAHGGGLHVTQRRCATQQCVSETVALAEEDPAVIRYEVLAKGDTLIGPTGGTIFAPLKDRWKS
ncbi:MAG: hypothetical protein KGL39_03280 [Patescibacteria group bacterium]|nr:hypothetical protein [Patescibacteria group bacterium]